MNIPLLYWAYEVTDNEKYLYIANNHLETTLNNVIRSDGSAYHTYFFDYNTGIPLYGKTRQGYADNSSWARGQAWLIYGIALNYQYITSNKKQELFKGVTNYFLNRLPSDLISYWDLIFTDGDLQARDSSAAAIAICGIDQMNHIHSNEIYNTAQKAILFKLITQYANAHKSIGVKPLIEHGTYSWHDGKGIDEGTIWQCH